MYSSNDFRPGVLNSERVSDDDELLRLAQERVDTKMGFLTHLLVFACVNAGFFVLGWRVFPIWGWALGLAIHGVVAWASLQGEGMRSRMLNREIEQLRRQAS